MAWASPAPAETPVGTPGAVAAPTDSTWRTRLFFESAMSRLPAVSTWMRAGLLISAAVAGPPSPLEPPLPVPTTVVMVPAGSTLRTRWLFESAM